MLAPKFRRRSKYGIFGNFVSKGGDRVKPPDVHFAVIASMFIILPSSYVVFFTNIQLFGLVPGVIVDLFYTCSILNLLRLIYLCAYTEPGIIPAVPSRQN